MAKATKVRLTSDQKVKALIKNLEAMGRPDFAKKCSKIAADLTFRFLSESTAAGTAPSGRPWKPRKASGPANKWVRGALRQQVRDKVSSVYVVGGHVAKAHQGGARRRPLGLPTATKVELGFSLPSLPKPGLPKLPTVPSVGIPKLKLPTLPTIDMGASPAQKFKRYKWKLPKRQILPGKRTPAKLGTAIVKAIRAAIGEAALKGVRI